MSDIVTAVRHGSCEVSGVVFARERAILIEYGIVQLKEENWGEKK
jgi:hypothetical protein